MLNTNKTTHLVPLGDIIEHKIDSKYTDDFVCICNPTIDYDNGMVIHHAMDGRAEYLQDDNN